MNFPLLSSNIPQSQAFGVHASQLIRYARASSDYDDFLVRSCILTSKLLRHGYRCMKLIATFKIFYGRHYDLIRKFQISVTHMVIDLFLWTLFLQWLDNVSVAGPYRAWPLIPNVGIFSICATSLLSTEIDIYRFWRFHSLWKESLVKQGTPARPKHLVLSPRHNALVFERSTCCEKIYMYT